MNLNPKLVHAVVVVVMVVWVANFTAGLVVEGYEPDPTINMVFLTIVGGLLALNPHRNKKDDDGD